MSSARAAIGDDGVGDLDGAVADVTGFLNVQHARLVDLTAEALAHDAWRGDGIRSPGHWLALRAGLSPERAKLVIRVAERASDFPQTMAAFRAGTFTLEQVAEVVQAPSWADGHVLDFAQCATVTQLRRTMRDRFFDEGPTADADATSTEPRDRLSFGATADHRWRINGELDLDAGRRIEAALLESKDALFERGDESATWADALVEMAESSLDSVASPARRDRYRTWLHLDVSNGAATTTDGWRIPRAVRDRLLCDGVVQPVWERDGTPFAAGRTQRVVSDRLRRVVERRDRGCRVPGCANDRWVEVHHIVHWIDGGSTESSNLISLCAGHHRSHHRGEFSIEGNPDVEGDLRFTDRTGRPIDPPKLRVVPSRDPDPPERRYEGPIGDRIDHRWFSGWVHPDELARRRAANRARRGD